MNQITGEGHWSNEWAYMTYPPETEGSFSGDLSPDLNWYWAGTDWQSAVSQTFTDEGLAALKEVNGLT